MNELFNFFIRNSKWFVFTFFVVASCVLLFHGNPYQEHVFLTSAGRMSSAVYRTGYNVSSYFNLREINDDLNRQNAELQAELVGLRRHILQLEEEMYTDTMVVDSGVRPFDFIVANVTNNSIYRPFNYLTIDKGRAEGVAPELGVVDRNGVVGIVSNVGEHNSRVISLLNPKFRLSCKIKRTNYFGSLVWDGNSPDIALLEELPHHAEFVPGDTIITSGYSAVFPSGLPVGEVLDDDDDHSGNFFTLKIRLFADFTTLGNVQVLRNNSSDELRNIAAVENKDKVKRKQTGMR